jgi:very-short-patch-repair endonuclease
MPNKLERPKCQNPICDNSVKRMHNKYCSIFCASTDPVRNQKISTNTKGKIVSLEKRLKLSLSSKGKKHSEETKIKIGNYFRGKKFSEEGKIKIKENAKVNPNFGMRGKKHSQKSKESMSITKKRLFREGKLKIQNKGSVSKLELNWGKRVKEIFGIELIHSYWLDGKCFDFKHPFKKELFEIDGVFWHLQDKAVINDREKDEIAKRNGYKLHRFIFNNTSKSTIDKSIFSAFFELFVSLNDKQTCIDLLLTMLEDKTLEKVEYLAKEFGPESLVDLYEIMQENGIISNQCMTN